MRKNATIMWGYCAFLLPVLARRGLAAGLTARMASKGMHLAPHTFHSCPLTLPLLAPSAVTCCNCLLLGCAQTCHLPLPPLAALVRSPARPSTSPLKTRRSGTTMATSASVSCFWRSRGSALPAFWRLCGVA